jgi:hypothetical protein
MDHLAKHWLDYDTIKFSDVCGKGAKQVPFGTLAPEAALDYAAEDADITLRLWQLFKPRLGRNRWRQFMKGWNVRLFRSLPRWRQVASPLTGLFWHACRMILPNVWQAIKPRFMRLPGLNLILPHPNSLARYYLTRWGCPAAKNRKPVPIQHRPMCLKIWPRTVLRLPQKCSNGGRLQN